MVGRGPYLFGGKGDALKCAGGILADAVNFGAAVGDGVREGRSAVDESLGVRAF